VLADQFVIASGANLENPFIFQGGVGRLNNIRVDSALIDNLTVGWAEIESAVINNLVVGESNIGFKTITNNPSIGNSGSWPATNGARGYYETFPFVDHALEWGLIAFGIGVARIAGTIINGRWKRSPRLRWVCGVAAFLYQGLHCFFFWQIGLSVIAIGYLLWTILEGMAIIRSTIDIARKRNEGCPTG
jgi:hypothetical protein